MMKRFIILPLLSVLFIFSVAYGAEDPIYTGVFSNKAISGYDSVAYFIEGKPVKGSKKFSTKYKGANWHFASQENLDTFLQEPEKYAPQYGGYCAYAVSQGYTASTEPEFWAVIDDKLYLNYSANVQKTWEKDRANYIKDADANWPKVLD